MFLGWLLGLLVACVLSLAIVIPLDLSAGAAFAVGSVLGFVCSWVGAELCS